MIEMFLAGLGIDDKSGQPVIVLADLNRRRALPIWTGIAECTAIAHAIDNEKPERPMTHDLMLNLIRELGFIVKQVSINESSKRTFYSTIELVPSNPNLFDPTSDAEPFVLTLDSRPSDAIALAIRARAPIFISEQVVSSGSVPTDPLKEALDDSEFHSFVENVKASDFKQ